MNRPPVQPQTHRSTVPPTLERIAAGSNDPVVHTDLELAAKHRIVVAFSERSGGVGRPPYDTLNLAGHVGDDPLAVDENRRRFLDCAGIASLRDRLVTAEQVHGDRVQEIGLADAGRGAFVSRLRPPIPATDALVTAETDIPLMLLYADCVPVVLVSSQPRAVAVVHAGWRGALAGLPGKTAASLARRASVQGSALSAYIGPHIASCCYDVDETLLSHFINKFGTIAAVDGRLDLDAVVRASLRAEGLEDESVVGCGACTLDQNERFFSYRASEITGRHAGLAAIMKVE